MTSTTTRKRAANGQFAKKEELLPAVTGEHNARLYFEEDLTLMGVNIARIHRQWIELATLELDEMPDIEAEAADAVDDLDKALYELDEARDGNTDADAALAEWKEDLAVGQAP
jgi:hypothetical protein